MRVFHIPERRIGLRKADLSTPWLDGHASPEDRALGFELELIELTRRRAEFPDGSVGAAELDAEIAAVRSDLVSVATLPDLRSVA
jgi:hypothetical protein